MSFYRLIHDDLNRIKGQIVAVIGGGGKSALLQKIGRELAQENLRVVLTSTTKFQPFPQTGLVVVGDGRAYLSELKILLDELNIAQVAKDYYEKDRLIGVNILTVQELAKIADVILIEADGSRQRSLKTHKDYEPVIPPFSTSVIIICGADVVGQSLNEKNVHRAELFSQKWSLLFGATLTPELIARELLSPQSYLRNVPLRAAVRIFINKSDSNPIGAKLLSEHLFKKTDYPIFFGSIEKNSVQRLAPENLKVEA